jgi:hypothetical protein
MERKVLWNRPQVCKIAGEPVYTSKCGRYRIEKLAMWSYNTQVVYRTIILATGRRIENDRLAKAKDEAEFNNDPNWEPS